MKAADSPQVRRDARRRRVHGARCWRGPDRRRCHCRGSESGRSRYRLWTLLRHGAGASVRRRQGGCRVDGSGRRGYFPQAIAPHGSMAEQTLVDERQFISLPDEIDAAMAVFARHRGTCGVDAPCPVGAAARRPIRACARRQRRRRTTRDPSRTDPRGGSGRGRGAQRRRPHAAQRLGANASVAVDNDLPTALSAVTPPGGSTSSSTRCGDRPPLPRSVP